MLEINELTRHTLTLTFSDETGAPVIPASFTFNIDIPNGAVIVPTTTLTPTGSTYELIITALQNKCTGSRDEIRRVTVVVTNLAATDYLYKLRKLTGVTP